MSPAHRSGDTLNRILGFRRLIKKEKILWKIKQNAELIKKLREVAPNAKFVDDYLQVRENLGKVWEIELKTDSQGLKRKSFGSFNLANVTVADNKNQFTKYSRLQREII